MEEEENPIEILSSGTRRRIIRFLDKRRMTVTELAEKLELSKATVHEHLSKLTESGLVEKNEDGRKWVYYELTDQASEILDNKVKKLVYLTLPAISAALGGYELNKYLIASKSQATAGVMTTETASQTQNLITSGNTVHLAAAIALFLIAAVWVVHSYTEA